MTLGPMVLGMVVVVIALIWCGPGKGEKRRG